MDPHDVPRPAAGVRREELDDELLLYRSDRSVVVALNSTAAWVWSLCDGKRDVAAIESRARDVYPEEADRVSREVRATLDRLAGEEVLEICGVPRQPP